MSYLKARFVQDSKNVVIYQSESKTAVNWLDDEDSPLLKRIAPRSPRPIPAPPEQGDTQPSKKRSGVIKVNLHDAIVHDTKVSVFHHPTDGIKYTEDDGSPLKRLAPKHHRNLPKLPKQNSSPSDTETE